MTASEAVLRAGGTPVLLKDSPDFDWPANERVFYVLARDGLYLCRNHAFFRSCVKARSGPSVLEDQDRSAAGLLHNGEDVDRFSFEFSDTLTDFFTMSVVLSNIPEKSNYRLTLNRLASDGDEALGQVDQAFSTGGSIELGFGDEALWDQGGTYEAVVEAIANADCDRTYLLSVQKK